MLDKCGAIRYSTYFKVSLVMVVVTSLTGTIDHSFKVIFVLCVICPTICPIYLQYANVLFSTNV